MDMPTPTFALASSISDTGRPIDAPAHATASDADLRDAHWVICPDYRASNPYQRGMYRALGPDGAVEYGAIALALERRKAADPSRPVIFHLHWPDPLFADVASSFDYQVRASDFLRAVRAFQAMGGVFLWTIHNSLPHEPLFGEAEREFHRQLAQTANLFHLHDEAAIARVRQDYPLDAGKCIIIPHGSYEGCYGRAFDTYQSRQLLGLGHVESLILLFGQIRPYKGLDDLIRAFRLLSERAERDQTHLLVAGKPMAGFTSGHARLIEENVPRVHMLDGFVPDAKLPLLFGAADLIALPYRDVLTSGTLMLAAHYGKPVVAPRTPALRHVEDAGLGLAYDPDQPDALALALDQGLALDPERRAAIAAAGRVLSASLAWDTVSARFAQAIAQRIVPRPVAVRVGRSPRTVQTVRRPDSAAAQLAVGIVHQSCLTDVADQLDEIEQLQDPGIRTYVFDATAEGAPHYGLQRRVDHLLFGEGKTSLAAAANAMLAIMRDDGCEQALLLDANMMLDATAIARLRVRRRDDAIVAPLVLAANGRIAQGGFRSVHDPDGCSHLEPLLVGDDPMIERQPYLAQALGPGALLLPLALLDRIGFLPEEQVSGQAMIDWTMTAKRRGVALVVQPASHARPRVDGSPYVFPGIEALYYDIRGQFRRARRMAPRALRPAPAAIRDHLSQRVVAPLRQAVARSSADLLPLFDRCARVALDDGEADLRGRVDVDQRIDAIRMPEEADCQGRIDRSNDARISGWAATREAADADWRPASLWLLRDGAPIRRIEPDPARSDVAAAGYGDGTGFTLPIPRRMDEDRALHTLRTIATGRRVAVSPGLQGDVWSSDRGIGMAQAPRLKAVVETVADGQLKGWAVDLAHPDIRLRLDVIIDNEQVASAMPADAAREDLRRAGIGDGRHGFALPLRNRYLLRESVSIELRLAGDAQCLVKKSVAVKNDNRGFSPYVSLHGFLSWSYGEDRMGVGHSELATGLLQQLDMEKQLLTARARRLAPEERVSVIMPAYNRATVIGDAIQSVLDQSHDALELIVIDDGSTDDTAQRVQNFADPRIHLIRLPDNRGVSVARNLGLERASGDIIAYLDTDNLWDKDYLAIMVAALADRRGYQTAYAGQIISRTVPGTDASSAWEEQKAIRLCPFNRSRLEERNFIDLNIFVHRRHLHGLYGGFDETLRRLGDWDLILRYTREWPPLMVPALLGRYQEGKADNQITATEDFNANRARLRIPTPATLVLGTRQEPRPLDMVVEAQSQDDLVHWLKANRPLLGSAVGAVAGLWRQDGVLHCLMLDAQSGEQTHCETIASMDELFQRLPRQGAGRPMLITNSAHAIRGDWVRTLDRLDRTDAYSAATGRLYAASTPGRFGNRYHDLTPDRIKAHVTDWSIAPSLSGQRSRQLPRDYLFIPSRQMDRLHVSASLSRNVEDMLDRYFDSFALSPLSGVYAADLIACHRDDVLPWA